MFYKLKKPMPRIRPEEKTLPLELIRVKKLRSQIGFVGVLPLTAVLFLMVHLPYKTVVAE